MESSEAPLTASKPTEVAPKAAVVVPDGYKIVKVRKPDGKIVKVRRPIAKSVNPAATSSTSNPTPKVDGQSTEAPSSLPAKLQEPSKTVVPKTIPSASSPKVIEKTSGSKGASEKVVAPPVHASKLETTAKGYRIFRRFHRVHHHASRLVEAFDPYSDVGDLQDGDEYMESDEDYNSLSGDSGDDDGNDPNPQSNSTNSAKGASTGARVNVNVGSNAASHRVAPAPKQVKTDVSVQEIRRDKSSSTDSDPIIREKGLLDTDDVEAAKSQVKAPRSLHRRSADWAKLIVWVLVIGFPIVFIGLAIAVATLNLTKYPSGHGEAIEVANRAGVTMWPIVFAAIVAQTLKALATYRVERGIRLMTLEQLISSHSVASALKQPFILRSLNWLTVGLLALWALSPLGSQAMQYTIGSEDRYIDNSTDIYYLNTAQDNLALQQISTSDQLAIKDSYSDSMAVLYAAVFQPISDYQPIGSDPWGNALVPVYELLESQPAVFPKNAQGGITIPQGRKSVNATANAELYSSFYGIPISEVDEYTGSWNFTMTSSYLHFDCPHLNSSTTAEIDLDGWNPQININGTGSLSMDMHPPTTSSAGSLFFRSNCSETQSLDGNQTYAYAVCEFNQTFVESTVYCQDLECAVTSIKKISGDPTSMYDFVDEFLKASDVGVDDYPTLGDSPYSATELYLLNPDNVTTPGAAGDYKYCDLPSVSSIDFNKRLSYLINTFYSTGFTTDYEFGALEPNKSTSFYKNNDTTEYNGTLTTKTEGITRYQDPDKPSVYTVDWVFLALFVFCSVILLVIGVSGVLLEIRTISPDILGFASSVARHSKHVKLPATDGTMSGAEKARLLKDARVMMQDVRPLAKVGRIVLGTASEGASKLKPGRLYR